ncbi:uncharacterized protein E0L32_011988 [Thyridium curvatum]|uniref:Dihydroxyacetone kinase n=1 Tax=Thyridium curvatum TaxID=1093900 RepID=A0A507B477_9PEZI|nr:uncharacterized protein E0L32_011988 [Thyridium curvatum]TPX17925.1 hypothetical protein E0L32_011988 [Thyridium curvatum]
MSTRHFVNDPTKLVGDALHSLTLVNPHVALDEEHKIIYRRPNDAPTQVSILSGGGSGHEPSFAGMVGPGMLSAAVAGTIFASPSATQVRAGITSRVDVDKGVLVVVMNYTGDVLSFGMAVEKARAAGIDAQMVVVGDDVGVGRAKGGKVGRRGIAGTVLVLKIAGALAALGRSLDAVASAARLAAENLVSVGASLDHVHVPGRAISTEDALQDGEVEIGMGIHNEIGSGRDKIALSELVSRMLAQLLDQSDKDRAFVRFDSKQVVLLINNLGGVSILEMGAITTEVVTQLGSGYNIKPARVLSGMFMTSLNGLGFSISLLNAVDTDGISMISLLDAPSEVPGWAAPIQSVTWEARNTQVRAGSSQFDQRKKPSGQTMDASTEKSALTTALQRVIAAEAEVTKYDTVVGDGDCGIGLKRGAEAVLKHVQQAGVTGDILSDLADIVSVVENNMDGTSGALYAIFLNALVHALQSLESGALTRRKWAAALKKSCDALSKYTPARPGDRTLIDALYPFVEILEKTGSLKEAALAARKAAIETQGMHASLGRSVYVGGTGFTKVPDPGAWGLSCFFLGLAGLEPTAE